MITAKRKLTFTISFICLILLYIFVIENILLHTSSQKYEQIYMANSLKGKTINDVIHTLGIPQKILLEKKWENDENYSFNNKGYELILIYYTDNQLINLLGLFPFGGSRIYIDQNGKVITFKEYND